MHGLGLHEKKAIPNFPFPTESELRRFDAPARHVRTIGLSAFAETCESALSQGALKGLKTAAMRSQTITPLRRLMATNPPAGGAAP